MLDLCYTQAPRMEHLGAHTSNTSVRLTYFGTGFSTIPNLNLRNRCS
jgi:hypothetical protein